MSSSEFSVAIFSRVSRMVRSSRSSVCSDISGGSNSSGASESFRASDPLEVSGTTVSVSTVSSESSNDSGSVKSISSNSTPSFKITVSNWENGLLTSSFMDTSGVKVILSCPSMTTRSPVLTLILSRASTSTTLKVPSPLIFTSRSDSNPSFTTSNSVVAKRSASFFFRPLFNVSILAISCIEMRSISRFLHSLIHLSM